MRISSLPWAVLLWMTACFALPVRADTWPAPETRIYRSANQQFSFTVVPGRFADNRSGPMGTLERAGGSGSRRVVWQGPLVNRTSPVEVLVSDAGDYVVTFDNWHSRGYGNDAVVVYDARGAVVASLSLDDLMPASVLETLPRSASSLWWGGTHRFNDTADEVWLAVAVPGSPRPTAAVRHFHIRLELATGRSRIVRDLDWTHALAAAAKVRDEQRRQREAFEGPLLTPATDSHRAWQRYSREVFLRLDSAWPPRSYEGLLLRMPPDRGYMGNVRSIRGMLGHSRLPLHRSPDSHRAQRGAPARAFVLASPAEQVLANALVQEAATLRAGTLAGWRVYVVCDPRDAGRLRMAFWRLGAEFTPVDPEAPIPQRPERISPGRP